MSEQPPEYDDGRAADRREALARKDGVYLAQALPNGRAAPTTAFSTQSVRLPVDDVEAWRARLWRAAVAEAVARLAAAECFQPGDRLLVERITPPAVSDEYLLVTARVQVEPAAPPIVLSSLSNQHQWEEIETV